MRPEEFAQRVNELTNHQWKLLEVLIKADREWLTRRQIAQSIGKRRLIPYDIGCLDSLRGSDLVEMNHIHDDTPIGFQVVYRASEKTMIALKQIHELKHNGNV